MPQRRLDCQEESICQDDFAPAIGPIIETMAKQMGATCLPRALVREDDGRVDCDLLWTLPRPEDAPAGTPTSCDQRDFLTPAPSGETQRCQVRQLPVRDDGVQASDGEGWYYDDFSENLMQCRSGNRQRIAFTSTAQPPSTVSVQLQCDEL